LKNKGIKMNPLVELEKFGQSVWLDNISREIIKNNELKRLIEEDGLKGVTSNPTIFQKAIGAGTDYDPYLRELLENDQHLNARQLFEHIAVRDIRDAAYILMNVYKKTDGADGFVSIEVSPDYAYDTKATIDEAARLASRTGRSNVMIKIPATPEGIPAIKEMISRGVNVNVTLIFSPDVYEQVAEAYIQGLELRLEKGGSIKEVASVASFFISRIDTVVDKELDKAGRKDLQGKTAIANAKLVYKRAKEIFGSDRFKKLQEKGAKVQRLLWASTGTKNPSYPETLYIDELIGKDTVNTMPPATINAFRKSGKLSDAIETSVDEAQKHMDALEEHNIDFSKITDQLTKDGVELFAESFRDLLNTIDKKKDEILSNLAKDFILRLPPGVYQQYRKTLDMWENESVASRLWKKDYTLWKENKEDDNELSNRLGWLDLPYIMQNAVQVLKEFAEEVRKEYSRVILLGMGGSSLAPEMFYVTFGQKEGYPSLTVLDSTHPESVQRIIGSKDLEKTLFIVSSKSGTTIETTSLMHTAVDALKKKTKTPGNNFVAITDSGTILETFAKENSFRKIFLTPSEVGGRYSALTYFGLVPAALIGVDVDIILNRAFHLMQDTKENATLKLNNGYKLGAALGELYRGGHDKLIFTTSEKISSFPSWIEQLVAESTGKEGKGILPVIEDEVLPPEHYKKDSALVYLRLRNDDNTRYDRKVDDLQASGVPVIYINLEDEYDLGRELYKWEIATALASVVMKINPFDQPDVQSAKSLANGAIEEYKKTGKLASQNPSYTEDGIKIFSAHGGESIKDNFNNFFREIKEGAYIAVLAFLDPEEKLKDELVNFKNTLARKYGITATYGFGPRYLHSTGQLHKGDGGKGYFIQFTSEIRNDLDVPGQGYSFGTLITAQAQGDLKALGNMNRRTLRIHFEKSPLEGLKKLSGLMER
jgi:transaldolase / glucose-6-phosphate isomerase